MATLAAGGVVVSLLALPWHRSGGVVRSGWALARVADELGLIEGPARRGLLWAAVLTPALVVAAAVLAAVGRLRIVALPVLLVAAIGLSCALVLRDVSAGQTGQRTTLGTAAVAVVTGLWTARRGGSP